MSQGKKHPKTGYEKQLAAYRTLSNRHVLVLEADISHEVKCELFHFSELERKAGNELTALMKRNYEQLMRTKRYRKLKTLYGKYSETENKDVRKDITAQMKEMQEQYHVTWNFCRTAMISIKEKYNVDAVFALTRAEDIWRAVEKCLYSDGETIHFTKRGDLPCIRAKQYHKGIITKVKDDKLYFEWHKLPINLKIKDRFEIDEVNAVLAYLEQPDVMDKKAVDTLVEEGICISTYRPCYATLVCKRIRGKMRVYVHITIEGIAKPKYNRNGELRHKFGKGNVGGDIGTQTLAYTSDTEVGLKNLAERGSSILENERKERLIYRAMDRSRRAMNPQNYNEDGTIKKGHKIWKVSNRYKRLKTKHRELCRINAENRHLAINEDVNHLRSLGDVFITEPKNAKKLQRRTKETTINSKGKCNRKKRFGRSIKNRCPGYLQAQIKRKFESTGGIYLEVPNNYRASQYDHTCDDYIKKKLSDRMYNLSDGTLVQRDWYSSFLLYNIDIITMTINKATCKSSFAALYQKELVLIEYIRTNHIKVLNSGIKVTC